VKARGLNFQNRGDVRHGLRKRPPKTFHQRNRAIHTPLR
jgi:hypothetical protein